MLAGDSVHRVVAGSDPAARASRATAGTLPSRSGHFMKMAHERDQVRSMQAYQRGVTIAKHENTMNLRANPRYDIELANVAEVWRRRSLASSWLFAA